MQTKRDQLRAYMFVVGRVKAALLRANPDAPSVPFRRSTSSTVAGVVLTLVVGAVFFVIGLLVPGRSDSWRESPSLIIAKETGARYLYLDGLLHPLLNFTSGRLVTGASAAVVTVSIESLADAPRGVPLGIPGAPDPLPAATALLTAPPMACSQPPAASAAPGAPARLVVAAGLPVQPSPVEQALLVRAPGGDVHLAWEGRRYRVTDPTVPVALGLPGPPRPVPQAWLDTLLPRADLTPPDVPGRGGPSAGEGALASLRSGQVLATETISGGRAYLLALPTGLAPVDELTAALVLADPRTAEAYGGADVAVRTVPATAVAGLPEVAFDAPASWPDLLPRADAPLLPADAALCTLRRADAVADDPPELLSVDAAELARAAGVPRDVDRDLVAVRPGAALLARSTAVPGVATGALFLVTDMGVRHAVPSADVAQALGYVPQAAVPVPVELLDAVPEAPALDPVAARTPQPVTGPLRGS